MKLSNDHSVAEGRGLSPPGIQASAATGDNPNTETVPFENQEMGTASRLCPSTMRMLHPRDKQRQARIWRQTKGHLISPLSPMISMKIVPIVREIKQAYGDFNRPSNDSRPSDLDEGEMTEDKAVDMAVPANSESLEYLNGLSGTQHPCGYC